MAFPGERYKNEPVNELYFFDYEALNLTISLLPDPVVARMAHMCEQRVHGKLLSAAAERSDSVQALLDREAEADQEKDAIVNRALTELVNRLMREKKITKEGDFYMGTN